MHVHVAHPDGEAKIWIEPDVATVVVVGLTPRQVAEAEDIVRRHLSEIRDAWVRHFGR
jgi:glycine cleavage system H lipoate-binding protein